MVPTGHACCDVEIKTNAKRGEYLFKRGLSSSTKLKQCLCAQIKKELFSICQQAFKRKGVWRLLSLGQLAASLSQDAKRYTQSSQVSQSEKLYQCMKAEMTIPSHTVCFDIPRRVNFFATG